MRASLTELAEDDRHSCPSPTYLEMAASSDKTRTKVAIIFQSTKKINLFFNWPAIKCAD